MAVIYLSSTYEDLKDWRQSVAVQLRAMRHTVIGMEDYAAADERPLDKCLADVEGCDIYIGIFAWRYGFIPQKDNPERQSITELEYRKAEKIPASYSCFTTRHRGRRPGWIRHPAIVREPRRCSV